MGQFRNTTADKVRPGGVLGVAVLAAAKVSEGMITSNLSGELQVPPAPGGMKTTLLV